MKGEDTTRMTLTQVSAAKGQTDWDRVRAASDDAQDDFDWSKAELVKPVGKELMSIRLDEDVLQFFRSTGKGYQTRINAVLRSYVQAQTKR